MRDFIKNLFSFSWAMSLFGARQAGSVLDPPDTTGAFGAVTDTVVKTFGQNLRQTFDVGDKLQGEIVDAVFGLASQGGAAVSCAPAPVPCAPGQPPIFGATSGANETILITYTRGRGTFSKDKRYIALSNQIFDLDGRENGLHEGVWEALFSKPEDLLGVPPPPVGPMDQPVGPVPSVPVSANTIAKWTHADGSAISSVGPAASHLIPLSDGSFLFLVITGQIITEGTGRFAGARGLTQSLGATQVLAGTDLFSPGGPPQFPAMTLDTFKYVTDVGSVDPRSSSASSASSTSSFKPSPPEPSSAAPQAPQVAPAWPTPEPTASGGPSCAVTPDPADSRFVEVHGSKMHYIDSGSGSPILFLHGDPTWSYVWRGVLPHVSPTARCIAPDLIGMGRSDKPVIEYTFFDHVKYVEGFIEALALKNFTMVLHDWGCIIGFYIAMRQESNVNGLAFMEAMLAPYQSWNAFPPELTPNFKLFRQPKVGHQLIVVDNVFIEKVLPESTVVPLSEEIMNCYREPFIDPASREVILQFVNQLPIAGQPAAVAKATGEYAQWLRKTTLPKLFLWAEPGLISTKKDVEWAQKNYKNLKTSFVGEGIHFLQESHPVEIGQEVSRWHSEIAG